MNAQHIVIYTRKECCLCDEAAAKIERRGLTFEKVDIDEKPDLAEQFDTCVPVVEIDGKIRFRGKVNDVLLDRILSMRK